LQICSVEAELADSLRHSIIVITHHDRTPHHQTRPALIQRELEKALHSPEAEAQLPDMRKLRVRIAFIGELEDVRKVSELVKQLSTM